MYVSVCMYIRMYASIAKWLGNWPGNQEVPGSISSCFSNNFTHIVPVYPWGPSGLVSTGEAAHLAVPLMGTWRSKYPTVLVSFSGVRSLWNFGFCVICVCVGVCVCMVHTSMYVNMYVPVTLCSYIHE